MIKTVYDVKIFCGKNIFFSAEDLNIHWIFNLWIKSIINSAQVSEGREIYELIFSAKRNSTIYETCIMVSLLFIFLDIFFYFFKT